MGIALDILFWGALANFLRASFLMPKENVVEMMERSRNQSLSMYLLLAWVIGSVVLNMAGGSE